MRNNVFSLISVIALVTVSGTVCAQNATSGTTPPTVIVEDPVAEQAKKQLEQELSDTSLAQKTAGDFPNRPSLGELELAPLPGIKEVSISGPAPMAQSVSAKDLPSEQLLGRITTEVFQEMADLERGNTFLQLQINKEKFKNALEDEKAKYRQKRLKEIAEREDVVRSRIKWWQDQENMRMEIEKKRAEEESLNAEIEEQKAYRDQLREEARKRNEAAAAVQPSVVASVSDKETDEMKEEDVVLTVPALNTLYNLVGVLGVKGELRARIEDVKSGDILTVRRDDILPSGHVVRDIKKDTLSVVWGNTTDQIVMKPLQ